MPVRNEWRVVLAMKHDDTGNMAASSTRERAREVVICPVIITADLSISSAHSGRHVAIVSRSWVSVAPTAYTSRPQL